MSTQQHGGEEPRGQQQDEESGQSGSTQEQDSPTLQRLRQRVREVNAQSEANALAKGGW
ncbi:hypothetical protein [Streptomyces hainanensis]|uniref:hypothetical protein n=1 Tax=Streptomyces hainanensis TaxID=402648 RepID=UPI001404F202|nr:hypothetical protein [Streptomyces hainanensis]